MRNPAGLRPALSLDLGAVSVAEGLRAALSVAAIVALAQWVHLPGLMEAALGALLSCLCDVGGSWRARLASLLSFGLLGAAITLGFGLLRGGPLWLVVVAASAGLFATSFARVGGQSALQVGNMLSVVLVLSARAPFPSLAVGLSVAGMFLLGSAWALLLTLVIWRTHPHGPARRATAAAMRQLADLAGDMRATLGADAEAWDRHARLHRRMARDAIERARGLVLQTARLRGPASARARLASARLEAVDQLFGVLIALSDGLQEDPAVAARAERVLRLLPAVLLLLARAVAAEQTTHGETTHGETTRRESTHGETTRRESTHGETTHGPALLRGIEAVRAAAGGTDWLATLSVALADRLRVVATVSEPAEPASLDDAPSLAIQVGDAIRRNLSWRSDALRHALRVLAVAVPAFVVTLWWRPTTYGHWFTITLVLTMQPYFAMTVTRAAERIGGTVLGGVVAVGLAAVCTTPLSMAAVLFPLTVVALAVRAVSFGVFIACLTPLVVLLSELGRPERSELTIALARTGFTAAGGVLALLGNVVLWPAWEPGRLAAQARAAIALHGRFARAAIMGVLGDPGADVDAARRAAGVASNALEASLQRVLLEPLRGRAGRVEAALAIDATLRRMAGALAGMRVRAAGHTHDAGAWRDWGTWIEAAMAGLAAGTRPAPPPALPPHDVDAATLARLARQVVLASGPAGRLL